MSLKCSHYLALTAACHERKNRMHQIDRSPTTDNNPVNIPIASRIGFSLNIGDAEDLPDLLDHIRIHHPNLHKWQAEAWCSR